MPLRRPRSLKLLLKRGVASRAPSRPGGEERPSAVDAKVTQGDPHRYPPSAHAQDSGARRTCRAAAGRVACWERTAESHPGVRVSEGASAPGSQMVSLHFHGI